MMDKQQMKERVCRAIDACRDRIVGLGESIMDTPELGFKEERTAQRVKETFQEAGLPFQDQLAVTGVKAILRGKRPGPTVALMGELDALIVPGHPRADGKTGAAHAYGHNAQIADHLSGNIVFLAVPAEEYVEIDYRLGLVKKGTTSFLCGKQELIRRGAFDDVDLAVMIHASSPEMAEGQIGIAVSSNGFLAKSVRFLDERPIPGPHPRKASMP